MADDGNPPARPNVNLLDKVKIWEGSADPSALDPKNRNGWRAYRIRTIMFLTATLCWNGMVQEGLDANPQVKLQKVDGLGGKASHDRCHLVDRHSHEGSDAVLEGGARFEEGGCKLLLLKPTRGK